MNETMGTDGQVFKAASFTTIGFTDAEGREGVRLSDLSVTGYADTLGGCWGNVWIDRLLSNGAIERNENNRKIQYFWYDDGDNPAGWYEEGGEVPLKDGQSEFGDADEITFATGVGICFNADTDGADMQLLCNGQVMQGQVDYVIPTDGQSIAGNPLARTITLSEMSVEGYADTIGGCWGNVWIDRLLSNGAIERNENNRKIQYFWYDDGDNPAGWYEEGGEVPLKDGQSEFGDADEIEFKACEGICINADTDGAGCTVKFPSLGLK